LTNILKMRKLFLFTLFNLVCWNLIAQQKTEFKFGKGTLFPKYTEKNLGLTYLKSFKATESDKSILFFLNFNESDSVKVTSDNEIILDKNLDYSPITGISEVKTIENTKNLKIVFLRILPIEILLVKKDLKKYKHIYISRKNGKYLVEYSNILKGFK